MRYKGPPEPLPPIYVDEQCNVQHVYGTRSDGSPKQHDDPLELDYSSPDVRDMRDPQELGDVLFAERENDAIDAIESTNKHVTITRIRREIKRQIDMKPLSTLYDRYFGKNE